MTVRHLAAGAELTRELTEPEFQTLNQLGLLSPCNGCTRMLLEGSDDDEVVYHPDCSDRHPDAVVAEIEAALNPKKH